MGWNRQQQDRARRKHKNNKKGSKRNNMNNTPTQSREREDFWEDMSRELTDLCDLCGNKLDQVGYCLICDDQESYLK